MRAISSFCVFCENFLGTVRLEMISLLQFLVMEDLIQGCNDQRVYYVEALNHNLFSVVNSVMLIWRKDVVTGLPKLTYVKDQLCSSCEMSKAKRSSFKSKAVPSSKGRLNLLHMDLCGPMRVASINGKKYILVIVDDYSRYTWTLFSSRIQWMKHRSSQRLFTMIQTHLQLKLLLSRTDKGTELTLTRIIHAYCKEEGIEHQTSTS
ncbi:retrovirus-related pol polyprotein from transposon TNT 1-94 [Tanacetum coccineum]